jgi:hypothetical protein
MSLGTWSLVAYSVPVALLAVVDRLPVGGGAVAWIHRLAVVAGIAPALAVAVYKGVLFSTSSQPGWKDARWLGAYLANSAIVLGCAELLVIAELSGQEAAVACLMAALALLLVVSVAPLLLLFFDVRDDLSRSHSRAALGIIAALVVGIGLVLPLLLLATPGAGNRLAAAAFVIFAAVVDRYGIVQLPHRPRSAT